MNKDLNKFIKRFYIDDKPIRLLLLTDNNVSILEYISKSYKHFNCCVCSLLSKELCIINGRFLGLNNIFLRQCDIKDYKNESFDLVICLKDFDIKEVHRILKSKGRIFIDSNIDISLEGFERVESNKKDDRFIIIGRKI